MGSSLTAAMETKRVAKKEKDTRPRYLRQVRSTSHWSPYDRVRDVDADP